MSFAQAQAAVERPKRLQFSNGVFYSFEGGKIHAHDTTDREYTTTEFANVVVTPLDGLNAARLIMNQEFELIAVSAAEQEEKEKAARTERRAASLPDPNLPPTQAERTHERKPIGSTWMHYPKLAGNEDVWPPGPAVIVEHVEPRDWPAGTPARVYVIERDGGVRLFANDASLVVMDSVPTQMAVSIEERSKLAKFQRLSGSPCDASGRKAVGSEWLFDPAKAGDPTGRPVLCRVVEQLDGSTAGRDYRVVTSGGAHLYASDASLTSLSAV